MVFKRAGIFLYISMCVSCLLFDYFLSSAPGVRVSTPHNEASMFDLFSLYLLKFILHRMKCSCTHHISYVHYIQICHRFLSLLDAHMTRLKQVLSASLWALKQNDCSMQITPNTKIAQITDECRSSLNCALTKMHCFVHTGSNYARSNAIHNTYTNTHTHTHAHTFIYTSN